jgi:hypothetical protein
VWFFQGAGIVVCPIALRQGTTSVVPDAVENTTGL